MNKQLYNEYNDIIWKIVKSDYDKDNALIIISDYNRTEKETFLTF